MVGQRRYWLCCWARQRVAGAKDKRGADSPEAEEGVANDPEEPVRSDNREGILSDGGATDKKMPVAADERSGTDPSEAGGGRVDGITGSNKE